MYLNATIRNDKKTVNRQTLGYISDKAKTKSIWKTSWNITAEV